jgi:hypothetical protein
MTVKYQIIFWRDIPAQVKAKAGRDRASKPLSQRFSVAIDEAAMRAGLTESADYLTQWRMNDWQEDDGDLQQILEAQVAELEAAYPPQRLRQLIDQLGLEKTGS